MSRRKGTRLAWVLVVATVAINAARLCQLVANVRSGLSGDAFSYASSFANVTPFVAFVAVGFLLATREPTKPLWLRHGVTR